MSRLTPNLYTQRTNRAGGWPVGLFGLQHGQRRSDVYDRLNHASWFNPQGHYLGAGDLSGADIHAITEGLAPDELFVVADQIGAACILQYTSVALIVQYAAYVLRPGTLCRIDRSGVFADAPTSASLAPCRSPLEFCIIQRWQFRELLAPHNIH